MNNVFYNTLESIRNIRLIIINLMHENTLIFFLIAGAFIFIISSFININKRVGLKKNRNIKFIKAYKNIEEIINKIDFLNNRRDNLANELALLTSKNYKKNKEIANYIFYILFCLTIAIYSISILVIKYLILKFIIPTLILVFMIFTFYFEVNRRKKKVQSTFPKVINVYTRKYSSHLDVRKAFEDSIDHIPSVHQYEFTRLLTSMTAPSEYEKALNDYSKRINTPLATTFIELLLTSFIDNKNILLGLIDLENMIAVEKKSDKRKINKLQDKKSNIYLGMMCMIGAIFVANFFLGASAMNFYFETFLGQSLIIIALIVVSITMLVMHIYDKIL